MTGVWNNSSININKYIWFPRLFPHKEWHIELLNDETNYTKEYPHLMDINQ